MKKLLLIPLLLMALALSPVQTPKPDPFLSIVTLVSGEDKCTAFSINQEKGIFLTVDHCMDTTLSINDSPATILATNSAVDLALLQADVHFPALQLGEKPAQNSEVNLAGRVASKPIIITLNLLGVTQMDEEQPYQFIFGVPDKSIHALMGMSGGPVLDSKGHVISVITSYISEDANLAGDTVGVFYPALIGAYAKAAELAATLK